MARKRSLVLCEGDVTRGFPPLKGPVIFIVEPVQAVYQNSRVADVMRHLNCHVTSL